VGAPTPWRFLFSARRDDQSRLVRSRISRTISSSASSDEYLRGPVIDADHLNELGWWDPNDLGVIRFPTAPPRGETRAQLETRIRSLYVDIADDLAARFPVA